MMPFDELQREPTRLNAPENQPKGGAPGKYDWARAVGSVVFFWADSGDWQPISQGEVRIKLEDWFSKQEQSPDDKSLKQYARWLFAEFRKRKPSE